ncbi:superoxide dismutase [Isoptericola variabilis]|uniref:Superoxide dismutase n=1 Tax=Isoptericola variabilis (strain 225) TaxID=743718 RepID=F6FWJ9_ISOV2|nr:superoxide dismutase [Isoptericola variabilis]AEG44573.1 Manganese/iron superoxide dismutase [Isoptericola variabilis 225]TWH28931.1 Fe-Mn family superoxide dismutase [Isoptericola variabilis J7]
MAVYTLPDLTYDYGALEPHISGKIMELHHSKHHNTYVTGANTALEKLEEARDKGDLASVNLHEKNLAFNLGGHVNHSAFWTNLSPEGGGEPTGEIGAAIDEHFGSFEKFKAHFTAVATGVQGSGWAILAWDSIGQKLVIVQLYDQQGNITLGLTPIVLLDCWEHAYYLDYLNVRPDYIKAWWNIVNWADAEERLQRARTQTAGLIVPA